MGKGLPGGRRQAGRIDYRTEPRSSLLPDRPRRAAGLRRATPHHIMLGRGFLAAQGICHLAYCPPAAARAPRGALRAGVRARRRVTPSQHPFSTMAAFSDSLRADSAWVRHIVSQPAATLATPTIVDAVLDWLGWMELRCAPACAPSPDL
jgi:hypothetical protein